MKLANKVALITGAGSGQGKAVAFGGVTVKNVSGYDLTKFLIGSAGSLCVITSIALRILPIPEASSLCELAFEKGEGVHDFLGALRSSVMVPSAVVMDGPPLAAASAEARRARRVLVAFEGHTAAVERQNRDLIQMAERHGGLGKAALGREAMTKGLRSAVDPDGFGTQPLALKVSVPLVQGPAAYSAVQDLAIRGELENKLALLAGNGVLFVYAGSGDDEVLLQFSKGVREVASRLGGHVVPIQGPRAVLSAWGPRLDPVLQRQVLKPIKQMLDPKGILLPLS